MGSNGSIFLPMSLKVSCFIKTQHFFHNCHDIYLTLQIKNILHFVFMVTHQTNTWSKSGIETVEKI